MSTSLEWVNENLTEAADDLEQDPNADEGTPLVPISEIDGTSMEDPLFQKLLVAIGIAKPADEQVSNV